MKCKLLFGVLAVFLHAVSLGAQIGKIVIAAGTPEDVALQAITGDGRERPDVILRPVASMIPWASPDVERAWQKLRAEVYTIIDAVPTKEGNLYGRIAEQTIRLASRHAL